MAIFLAFGWAFLAGNGAASSLALAATIALSILAALMGIGLSRKLGGWDKGATKGVLCKGAIAAILTYIVTLYFQRWLGGAFASFDTAQTLGLVKFAVRSGVVIGGALVGTLIFILSAGVLGLNELGPLSRFSQKLFCRKS